MRASYDRVARFYDFLEAPLERWLLRPWREQLLTGFPPGRVLEVGIGTGRNLGLYPTRAQVTGIDLSIEMLRRAQAKEHVASVDLCRMDVAQLAFRDDTFDAAVVTCVFCCVPEPVQGLREVHRVLKPGARLMAIEHVRPERPWLGRLVDQLNPLAQRFGGENFNRRTVQNMEHAGLRILSAQRMSGVFRMIVAEAAA